MTLYRMELYRIIHRRLFWGMGLVILVWLAIFFCLESVGSEASQVNGKAYEGYAAVRMDREITEDFEGSLTDEDVNRITEKYGLPSEVQKNYGNWIDENYLTGFVAKYLTDGFFQSWDEYKVPQSTIPINDSRLKEYSNTPQGEVTFGYTKGWKKFLEIFQMANWLFSLMIMIGAAPLFCEERQNRMQQIIFTSEKGKGVDVKARIAAIFTVTVCGYFLLLVVLLGLCGGIFGLGGSKMSIGIVLGINSGYSLARYEIAEFTLLYVVTALGGILMLTAIVVWISARVDTVAHSLLAVIFSWAAPVVLYMTFQSRVLYILALIQPALMSNYGSIIDAVPVNWLRAAAVFVVMTVGIVSGARRWQRADV